MSWLDVIGGGTQAFGTYYAYQAQEKAGERAKKLEHENARMSEEYAEYLKELRERKLKILAKQTEQVVGAQKVSYAKSGVRVGTGTAREMERHTRTEAELDAAAIREDAEYEITRLYDVAAMHRTRGGWMEEGAEWQARATLMSGLSGMIDIVEPYYYRYID